MRTIIPKQSREKKKDITRLAQTQFDAFRSGVIDASRFTEKLQAAITPAIVARVKAALQELGPMASATLVAHTAEDDIELYTYKIVCENGAQRELLGIDRAGRIAAIYFKPWDS